MERLSTSLASGALFGLGLTVSHMINPAKVLGFLDVAGDWDPSLAFVMLGALIVATPAYVLSRRLRAPLYAEEFARPGATRIDHRLIIGALLFGIGWGLVGYCPGPALASIGLGGGRLSCLLRPCWPAWPAMPASIEIERHQLFVEKPPIHLE